MTRSSEGDGATGGHDGDKHAHFDQDQVPPSPGQQDDRDHLSSASDDDSRAVEVCPRFLPSAASTQRSANHCPTRSLSTPRTHIAGKAP